MSNSIEARPGVLRWFWRKKPPPVLTRYQRTDAEIIQDEIEFHVTGGMKYRPSQLLDDARRLSLTTDGQEDILTVHVHLAAMGAIYSSGGRNSHVVHAKFRDLVDAVQEVRKYPKAPRYFTHMALADRFLESPLNLLAVKRLLREVEFISAIRSIATGGREFDYTL